MNDIKHPDDLLARLKLMALEGGREAMRHYRQLSDIREKADLSPVTEADIAVDALLFASLQKHFPSIGIVTEERVASHILAKPDAPFFLVDPIDGTKEFIRETGEFTINIALIENGEPVAGVVFAPAVGRMFCGQKGKGSFECKSDNQCGQLGDDTPIRVKNCDPDRIVAVASKSHLTPQTSEFLNHNKIDHCTNAGSSLKFCLLAAGEADIYPRFGPTMEWDTAAGHAVLAAAGGIVEDISGAPLTYGKPEFRNPDFIAASPTAKYSLPEFE